MIRKRTFIASLATIILLLSATAGASGQADDTQTISAELVNPLCSMDFRKGTGSFGTWDWNGTAYAETSGRSTLGFYGLFLTAPKGGCNLTVTFTGLSGTGGTIGPKNFTANATDKGTTETAARWTHNGVELDPLYPFRAYDFSYTLNTVPSLPVGTYSGTITISFSNAA